MTPQTNWLPAAELAVQSASIEHIMAIALEFVRLPVNDRPLYSFCSRTLLRELLDDCKKNHAQHGHLERNQMRL